MLRIPEPKGDVKRLPKWAQEYIQDLNRAREDAESEITRVTSDHQESNLRLDGKGMYPSKGLPPNATIQFYMGDSRNDLIEIYHNRNPATNLLNSLEVTAHGGPIAVYPRVSNGVSLVIDARRRY